MRTWRNGGTSIRTARANAAQSGSGEKLARSRLLPDPRLLPAIRHILLPHFTTTLRPLPVPQLLYVNQLLLMIQLLLDMFVEVVRVGEGMVVEL